MIIKITEYAIDANKEEQQRIMRMSPLERKIKYPLIDRFFQLSNLDEQIKKKNMHDQLERQERDESGRAKIIDEFFPWDIDDNP